MRKKARTRAASQVTHLKSVELRRVTDAGSPPDWFPKTQDIWTSAMNHVNHHQLVPSASPRRFSLPPIHLFWGGNEENQRVYYYHFLVLRREIRERPMRDLPALTTSEWRSILGNAYWKKQWPKPDSAPPGAMFDPDLFWKHGGPVFFGDQRSADVAAGCHDPVVSMPCRCAVKMTMADDPDVRQVILYYLNLYNAYEEIKEMERDQFPANFEKQWRRKEVFVYRMVEMWDATGGGTEFKFFRNKTAWRDWLSAVREVVNDWAGFDSWDWGGFSDVRGKNIKALDSSDFRILSLRLLIFFINSFVTRLGYYPSHMLVPPTLATASCADRIHRQKFGHGYPLFVM
jgi:hypothetical protein